MTPDWRDVIIAARSLEARDIVALELRAADGLPLPAFEAGAHIDVRSPAGLVRQYSLYGRSAPHEPYRIAVLRDPNSRGGSRAMHDVGEGDRLQISAPRNLFALAGQPHTALLLAGGIGITPILAMAHRLQDQGRPFQLHYAARSPDRMAFRNYLENCVFGDRVVVHFNDGPPDQRLDLTALLAGPGEDAHLYVCGPNGMIQAALQASAAAGWPQARVHREHFAAPETGVAAGAFDVVLARSGATVHVGADQTVVQALSAAGMDIEVSCEQGVCGTCLTRVLDGIPDHRDVFLTPQEQALNDVFTPCCSRAKTNVLVLDLWGDMVLGQGRWRR